MNSSNKTRQITSVKLNFDSGEKIFELNSELELSLDWEFKIDQSQETENIINMINRVGNPRVSGNRTVCKIYSPGAF